LESTLHDAAGDGGYYTAPTNIAGDSALRIDSQQPLISAMRFFPRTLVCALAAFVAGYGISRAWSSANSPGIKGIKSAIHSAQLIVSAASSDGTATERLIKLCEQPSGLDRDQEIFEALQKMNGGDFLRAVADFPALFDRFDKLSPNLRNMIAEAAIERWLEVDPDGLKQWLANAQILMKNFPGRGEVQLDLGVLWAITPALARNDPDWCKARIESMKGHQKVEALSGLLRETAKTDPNKARAILAGITGEQEKDGAMDGLIGGLAESEPQAAINLIHGLTNTDAQRSGRTAAIWATGPRGAAAQRDLLSQIDDPNLRPLLLYYATYSIAEQSTSDPFAFVQEQLISRTEDERAAILGPGLFRALVDTDPSRATEFVSHLEGKARANGIESMFQAWPYHDPAAAVAWLATLRPEDLPVNSRNWNDILGNLAYGAPAEFQRWVDSLPAGDLQDNSRVLLATRFARNGDVAQAIQLFQQSATGKMSEATANTFGRTIASLDPARAAECVTQLPSGPVQSNAALGVASTLSERNPQAAADWIAKLPPGCARDSATNGLASTLVYADPAASIEWLDQIRDPAIRSKAAQKVFGIWTCEDPAGARSWFSGLDYVDADRKSTILRNQR
jgi:hypothetical protein